MKSFKVGILSLVGISEYAHVPVRVKFKLPVSNNPLVLLRSNWNGIADGVLDIANWPALATRWFLYIPPSVVEGLTSSGPLAGVSGNKIVDISSFSRTSSGSLSDSLECTESSDSLPLCTINWSYSPDLDLDLTLSLLLPLPFPLPPRLFASIYLARAIASISATVIATESVPPDVLLEPQRLLYRLNSGKLFKESVLGKVSKSSCMLSTCVWYCFLLRDSIKDNAK